MRFICFILLIINVLGCSKLDKKRSELLDFVPKNTSVIIKTSKLEGLYKDIDSNDFLQRISKAKVYENIQERLKGISKLNPSGDLLVCFSTDKNDSLQYSVITKNTKNLFLKDSLSSVVKDTLLYKNQSIIKLLIHNKTIYTTIIDSVFFASSSKAIVHNAFRETKKDMELKKAYNTFGNDKTFSVLVKPKAGFVPSFFIEDSLSLHNFASHIAVDVKINQNEIYFNGIARAIDSTESLINIFKNTVPQTNQTQRVTPPDSNGFMSFSFDDFKILESNLLKWNKKAAVKNKTTLFNNIVEVGVIHKGKSRAIVLNSTDIIVTKDALLNQEMISSKYRGTNIYKFTNPALFSNTFKPLINYDKARLYCVLDNFFVFSGDLDVLQSIIANYQNKTSLSNILYFKEVKKKLSEASSLLQVIDDTTLKSIFEKNGRAQKKYNLKSYGVSAIQFIYENDFAHINGIIKKRKTKKIVSSVSEKLNVKLERAILNTPQYVKNHITKQKEIIVQDVNYKLYLISNKGKTLWTKQLEKPILGKIEQIDRYKNGQLQIVFATSNRVYVLDRKGKDVKKFPLKFKKEITQPLAIFDYDNRKKYRFLVTQGKNVLMYDVKGKRVKGFTFKSANKDIVSKPKHFRIGDKDYIVIKTKNRLYILDRLGKVRIKPKQYHSYSKADVFLYNNTFTTTTSKGALVSVDKKGNVSSKKLNLSKNHFIKTRNKTLVTQSENKLTIKNKMIELDLGNYSSPQLFYINNKTYVSTTDLESHKIYIYDSQSRLLPNFPVYGNSPIAFSNIDEDSGLEFVTKGDDNTIILYQIN